MLGRRQAFDTDDNDRHSLLLSLLPGKLAAVLVELGFTVDLEIDERAVRHVLVDFRVLKNILAEFGGQLDGGKRGAVGFVSSRGAASGARKEWWIGAARMLCAAQQTSETRRRSTAKWQEHSDKPMNTDCCPRVSVTSNQFQSAITSKL